MRPGITVSIGLDKSTKLDAVFKRYVEFCNETSGQDETIRQRDLEFVFCQVLNEVDTAETSALMKGDRIIVRKIRKAEREADAERKRTQRDMDRNYFQQMRQLMPEHGGGSKAADVILDCKGKIVDKYGRNQRVLRTTVRAHSVMINKRCPWLGNIIEQARSKARQEALEEENEEDPEDTPEQLASGATEIEDEEDGDNSEDEDHRDQDDRMSGAGDVDMVVDDDDDDDEEDSDDRSLDSENEPTRVEDDPTDLVEPSQHYQHGSDNLLVVSIPDHSPEAVKILLEYCYTNRCVVLGNDAFVQACKTRPSKHQGPVPPYHTSSHHSSKKWPNDGNPQISFPVALAAIRLAEEAGMPRLSLMCEVAASRLVTSSTVTEALFMSSKQKSVSGNDLPRLRKAAMNWILRRGTRGVAEIGRNSAFKKALQEDRAVIVPTLMLGTMEAVTDWEKSKGIKRDSSEISHLNFDELDMEDNYEREKERRRRRKERLEYDPDNKNSNSAAQDVEPDESFEDFVFGSMKDDAARKSLKRMSHHLDAISRRTGSRGGNSFFGTGTGAQQRSTRRRRSRS